MIEAKTEIGFCTGMTPHASTGVTRDAVLKKFRAVLALVWREGGDVYILNKVLTALRPWPRREIRAVLVLPRCFRVQQEATKKAVLAANPG